MIQKVYEVDPLVCPKWQGEMIIIAFIEQPHIIKKILKHLKRTRLIPDQVKSTCCIHEILDTQVPCIYTRFSEKQGLIPNYSTYPQPVW